MPGASSPSALSITAVARNVPLRVSIVGLMRVIVAAGGGAGIAAVFNAPLGGFFYAIEELLRQSGPVLLLLVMSAFWGYFTLAEYLTTGYASLVHEKEVFHAKWSGEYAPWFWTMVVLNFIVPFAILLWRKGRTPIGTTPDLRFGAADQSKWRARANGGPSRR